MVMAAKVEDIKH